MIFCISFKNSFKTLGAKGRSSVGPLLKKNSSYVPAGLKWYFRVTQLWLFSSVDFFARRAKKSCFRHTFATNKIKLYPYILPKKTFTYTWLKWFIFNHYHYKISYFIFIFLYQVTLNWHAALLVQKLIFDLGISR